MKRTLIQHTVNDYLLIANKVVLDFSLLRKWIIKSAGFSRKWVIDIKSKQWKFFINSSLHFVVI